MITIEEIRKRISKKDSSWFNTDYNGFDMSKTHSQDNSSITLHNKEIISLFRDYLDVEYICKHFDCWKGVCFWNIEKIVDGGLCNYSASEIDFGGWDSDKIIEWLIINKNKFIKIEEDEAIKQEIGRIITPGLRYEVLKRQKWRCNICGTKLKYDKNSAFGEEVAHIDHIFPYSKRDSYINGAENINEIDNLQALCPKCNRDKWNKQVN